VIIIGAEVMQSGCVNRLFVKAVKAREEVHIAILRPLQALRECIESAMDFEAILQMITPEVHERLKCAVEIGRWEDGIALSREQRELCLQAIIVYEARNMEASVRTGHIERGPAACDDEPDVIRIVRAQQG
jgi:uncharacterized protein YeaC (DUF1315 family)